MGGRMGRCLAKIKHDVASCGGGGLQIFEGEDGTVNGYCFSCFTYVANPYGEVRLAKDIPKQKLGKSKEQVEQDFKDIKECKAIDLKDRRLRAEALGYFGIKIGVDTKDGKTPRLAYFPFTSKGKVVKYKVKLLDRKVMWSVGDSTDLDLFGWEAAIASGARRLIITEGEWDAAALRRIFEIYTKPEYRDNIPAVVSLINGASSAGKDLVRLAQKINKYFQEVSFCYDDDDAGRLAVEASCKALPDATSITLPGHDANDCLKDGKGKAAFSAAMWRAGKPKNTRLVWGREVHEQAKKAAEWGLSFPWEWLTSKTRGLRFGETYYIAAGEKMGKSEVVNAFASHFMKEHKLKVMVAKPEEANNKTYKMVLSKLTGTVFHDPKVKFDSKAYEEGGKIAKDYLCMVNLYQHIGWETLKLDMAAAAAAGVKLVMIDPITNLTNGMANSEIDAHLKGVVQEASAIAMDLDIAIIFFCHLNKPAKGATPWDRGGVITTDYFAGSSGMARSCNYAIGIEGNRDPELPEDERNIRKMVLLADREFGESGYFRLFWNKNNHLFVEMKE